MLVLVFSNGNGSFFKSSFKKLSKSKSLSHKLIQILA